MYKSSPQSAESHFCKISHFLDLSLPFLQANQASPPPPPQLGEPPPGEVPRVHNGALLFLLFSFVVVLVLPPVLLHLLAPSPHHRRYQVIQLGVGGAAAACECGACRKREKLHVKKLETHFEKIGFVGCKCSNLNSALSDIHF